MIIYKATSKTSGKSYIGQTKDFEARKRTHKFETNRRRSTPLYRAIAKYGWDDFDWQVLEVCISREHLNERETFYIKLLNTVDPHGYNLENGGRAREMHKETKAKLREMNLGEKNPRYKKTPWNKGLKTSDETRARQSRARHALKNDPNYVHPCLGKVKSPEERAKSAPLNPLRGDAHREAHKNMFTDEVREKMSDAKRKLPFKTYMRTHSSSGSD